MEIDLPAPKTILLAVWDGGGVVPPLLGVAKRMIERGHRVVVLGDPTIASEAAAIGADFAAWNRAPHRLSRDREADLVQDYLGRPRQHMRQFNEYFFASGENWTADTLDAIDEHRADMVMADFMLIWAGLAAQIRGLPFVSLLTFPYAIPSPGFPPLGADLVPVPRPLRGVRDRLFAAMTEGVYDRSRKVLNRVREQHGLPAVRHSLDQLRGGGAIVVLTARAFDRPGSPAPANVSWSGPILDDPPWADQTVTVPWDEEDDRPLVVVAMSSTFQDQADALRRVVGGLSSLPVRAALSLGPALRTDEVPGASNVWVTNSFSHADLIPQASVVVTHCGHGTAIKSLTAGVPMVCIPMGRDQGDNAARVVALGAGVKLGRKAPVPKIRAAVQRVLTDSRYRDAARGVAAAIADGGGDTDPVATIETVLARGAVAR